MLAPQEPMLRERPGSVAVWIGVFPNAEALHQFSEATYDEEGNGACPLWILLNVPFFDHDFQEVYFAETHPINWKEQLQKNSWSASYSENVARTIARVIAKDANSTLLLFDHFWHGNQAPGHPLTFIGNFEYKKD